uniref:Uncharacterized protein n=1 Tax=Rhizophora mucronata TaxID=61149 RepID=A0A2P2PT96_RHIMU
MQLIINNQTKKKFKKKEEKRNMYKLTYQKRFCMSVLLNLFIYYSL